MSGLVVCEATTVPHAKSPTCVEPHEPEAATDAGRGMAKLRLNVEWARHAAGRPPAAESESGRVLDVNSLYPEPVTSCYLVPPLMDAPKPVIKEHTDAEGRPHWDATKFVTTDGGWTWTPRSAVNMATEERAREWANS